MKLHGSDFLQLFAFVLYSTEPSLAPVNFVAFYNESLPTTVQLAWHRVPVEGRNGIIIGYLLTVTDEIEDSVSVNVTVTELSYEIRDLMLNTAYNISVAGFTSAGPGPAAYDLVETLQWGEVANWHVGANSSVANTM